ncbi:mucoidy inhibitor MuiA family protein [Cardiobacteriaceae bacterium TAE3-ERU3]|nr:mucoidy inhibitor MuiA family protein [Cardiobacteriaceae bacterium TAE3-ERU3]
MKRTLLAAFITLATTSALADDFRVDAPVTEAVVYHNMADVTRHVQVNIPKTGLQRIIVPKMIATSDGSDIRPVVEGATLLGVSAVPDWDIDDSILQKQIRELELNLELNAQEIAIKKAMMQGLAESLRHEGVFTEVQAQQATLQKEYAQLLLQRSTWQRELTDLQKQQAWQEQGNDGSSMASLFEGQALVFDVDVERAGEVSLTWQARTAKAYWQSSSEWSLDSATGRLSVSAHADLVQNTGLDWTDATLALAIVPPDYLYLPNFEPQVVRAVDPQENPPLLMAQKSTADDLIQPLAMAEYAAPAPNTPTVEESGIDFRVVLPGSYDIESSKTTHTLTYWRDEIDATVYSAVYDWSWPKEKALLIAEWTMPDGINVLKGTMTLYRDNNYLAELSHGLMAAGSKQVLSFGQDPQLLVEMDNPPGYTENHGLISKSHELSQRSVVKITNNANVDKNVHIYSRLPVSTAESVEVIPVWSPKPNEENTEGVKGLTLWKKSLTAKETWQIETGFDIKYPDGKRLIGL